MLQCLQPEYGVTTQVDDVENIVGSWIHKFSKFTSSFQRAKLPPSSGYTSQKVTFTVKWLLVLNIILIFIASLKINIHILLFLAIKLTPSMFCSKAEDAFSTTMQQSTLTSSENFILLMINHMVSCFIDIKMLCKNAVIRIVIIIVAYTLVGRPRTRYKQLYNSRC
jgi:hypothetical protein